MNGKRLSSSTAGGVLLAGEISVHRVGFECMGLTGDGIWRPPKDRKAALAVLRRAVEVDVNFIDTRTRTGPNVSEALFPYLGRTGNRHQGRLEASRPWPMGLATRHRHTFAKRMEGSLKRLRLERMY